VLIAAARAAGERTLGISATYCVGFMPSASADPSGDRHSGGDLENRLSADRSGRGRSGDPRPSGDRGARGRGATLRLAHRRV